MTNALPPRLLVVWHLLDLARTHVGHSHGPFHGFATGATLCDDRGLGPSAVFFYNGDGWWQLNLENLKLKVNTQKKSLFTTTWGYYR